MCMYKGKAMSKNVTRSQRSFHPIHAARVALLTCVWVPELSPGIIRSKGVPKHRAGELAALRYVGHAVHVLSALLVHAVPVYARGLTAQPVFQIDHDGVPLAHLLGLEYQLWL